MKPPTITTFTPKPTVPKQKFRFTFYGQSYESHTEEQAQQELERLQRKHYSRAVDFYIALHLFGWVWVNEYARNKLISPSRVKEFTNYMCKAEIAQAVRRDPARIVDIAMPSLGSNCQVPEYQQPAFMPNLIAALARKHSLEVRWVFQEDSVQCKIESQHGKYFGLAIGDKGPRAHYHEPTAMGEALRMATHRALCQINQEQGDPAETLFDYEEPAADSQPSTLISQPAKA